MKLSRLETEALLYGTRDTIGSVEQALADAERIGHAPLVAEATLTLGWFLQYTDNPRARSVLERAANLAEASDLPSIKERAQRQLVTVAVQIDHDYERAAVELDRLMATLTRLDDPPVGTAGAMELRSLLAAMKGDYDRARADLRTAIGLWREIGNHRAPRQANAWRSLGDLLAAAGRHDEARQAFAHADALTVEPTLDGDLPSLQRGRAELTQGQSAVIAGRLDEADALLAKAHAEGVEAYGEDSVFIARVAMAQSDAANRRGQLDVAAAHAQRADANIRRWMGDDPLLRVSPLSAVGTVAFDRGQFEVSIDAYAEALRLWLRSMPADSPQVAIARSNLAEALVATEQYERAEPELRRVLAALQARMDPGHPWLAFPAHGLAEIEFRRGQFEPALEHGRIALEIREASGDHPSELARIRWLMARIYLGTGTRDEALRLARSAREDFIRLGKDFATEVEAIDTWLEDN